MQLDPAAGSIVAYHDGKTVQSHDLGH